MTNDLTAENRALIEAHGPFETVDFEKYPLLASKLENLLNAAREEGPRSVLSPAIGDREARVRLEDWVRFGGPRSLNQWPEIANDLRAILALSAGGGSS